MSDLNDKLWLSAAELGGLLGVHCATIWTWNSGGKIPQPVKIGGTTRNGEGTG